MAKFPKPPRLSKKEREVLFERFCQALVEIKNPSEAAHFLRDLLSQSEVDMLARRLATAELLIEGLTYSQIQESLKVSKGTIAKVATWLAVSGEGYRAIVERSKRKKIKTGPTSEEKYGPSWYAFRRRYPSYFWPQILLEEIIFSANHRQKEKITKALSLVSQKSALFKRLDKILQQKV